MKTDHLEELQRVIARDLMERAGWQDLAASSVAQFVSISVIEHYAGSRVNFRTALLAEARNSKMRELNRQAVASVRELVDLTGLDRSHVYRILRAKVAGARRTKD